MYGGDINLLEKVPVALPAVVRAAAAAELLLLQKAKSKLITVTALSDLDWQSRFIFHTTTS